MLSLTLSNVNENLKKLDDGSSSTQISNVSKWQFQLTNTRREWEKWLQSHSPPSVNLDDIEQYVKDILNKLLLEDTGKGSPLGQFFNYFINVFTGSYYAILEGRKIQEELQHASDDIRSFSAALNDILFSFVKSQHKDLADYSEYFTTRLNHFIACRIYSTLFPLYEGSVCLIFLFLINNPLSY